MRVAVDARDDVLVERADLSGHGRTRERRLHGAAAGVPEHEDDLHAQHRAGVLEARDLHRRGARVAVAQTGDRVGGARRILVVPRRRGLGRESGLRRERERTGGGQAEEIAAAKVGGVNARF